jgi:hypothetical protein
VSARRKLLAVAAALVIGGVVLLLLRERDSRAPARTVTASAVGARGPGASWTARGPEAQSFVAGRIVDSAGAAVAEAMVAAVLLAPEREQPGLPRVAAETAVAAGGYRLGPLAAGHYWIHAGASGFLPASRQVTVDGRADVRVPDLVLTPGGELLSGRVLDASGGPIAGARVSALLEGGLGARSLSLAATEAGSPLVLARSDGEGRYRLTLARARHTVRAEADGYAPLRTWIWLEGPETHDFRLVPAAAIAGRVLRAKTGQPVAGAHVRAEAGWQTAEAESDAEGAFTLPSLEPANYRLMATAGPLAGRLTLPVSVRLATRVEGVVVEVDHAHAIAGHVRRSKGGPVAGARVSLWNRERARGEIDADRDGAFRFEGVLPDAYVVEARAAGLTADSAHVTVTGEDVAGLALSLQPTAAIQGRVVDDRDRPLAGVMVAAEVEAKGSPRPVRSDDDGRFLLDDLPPGDTTLRAEGGSRGRTHLELGQLGPGERREITLRLSARGAFVAGQVRWRDGRPAANVVIAANNMRLDDDRQETTTDRDGRYRIGPFSAGALVMVHATASDARPFQPENGMRSARVEEADVTGIDFVLTASAAEQIRGVVLGPEQKGLPGAVVLTSGIRAVTDQDGAFALEGLSPGDHDLFAEYPGLPPSRTRGVAAGRSDVRIQLVRGAAAAGVVEGVSGRGSGLCSVWARRAGEPPRDEAADQAICGAGATFELRGLAPGDYELVATTLDGRSGGLAHVHLREGEEQRGLHLRLGGGWTVVGRAIDLQSRRPLAGARIRVVVDRAGSAGTGEVGTDADGRFEIASRTRGLSLLVGVEAAGHEQNEFERRPGVDVDRLDVGDIPLLASRPGPPLTGRAGIVLGSNEDGSFYVIDTVAELPAAKAGIRAGDLIVAIDGHDLTNANLGAAVGLIRGEPGTALVLEVRRPEGPPRRVRLVRA